MSIATLEKKFAQLPEEKQKEVKHLIEELLQKVKASSRSKGRKAQAHVWRLERNVCYG